MPLPGEFTAHGQPFNWQTLSDVYDFLGREFNTWHRFLESAQSSGLSAAIDQANTRHKELEDSHNRIRNEVTSGGRIENVQNDVNFARAWAEGPWASISRGAQRLDHAREVYGALIFGGFLAAYGAANEGARPQYGKDNAEEIFAGRLLALLLKEKIPTDSDFNEPRLLRNEWDAKLKEFSDHAESVLGTRDKALAILQEDWIAREEKYLRIKEFDAAADYWAEKRTRHIRAVASLAPAIVLIAFCGVFLLVNRNEAALSDMRTLIQNEAAFPVRIKESLRAIEDLRAAAGGSNGPAVAASHDANEAADLLAKEIKIATESDARSDVWRVALLIRESIPTLIIAVALFWLLRILVRIFLTQLHLWSDASERVVMIKTYLAMHVGAGVLEGKSA
ncbi:MAG TPA: hypothetical protein VGM05_11115, partial [Planctomycetaceae bacterium]